MEEKVAKFLESIGLNKSEIKVYLSLVRGLPSTALDISKRTGIHRSNTYDAIRALIDKGFISEIVDDKRRLFKALEPSKIKDYISQKSHEAEEIIPFMSFFKKNDEEEGKIFTGRGVFSAREAMNDLLKFNKDIRAFGAPKEIIDILGLGFLKEFHKERMKRKIWMRHIYNADAIDRIKALNKLSYTEAHYIDKQYEAKVVTLICGNTVVLFILSNPLWTIVIKDATLADSYSQYFDALQKRAKKPE